MIEQKYKKISSYALLYSILILIFDLAGVLTYIEPYQPIIGFTGIGLLSYATYHQIQQVRS